jgi:hypothetical protein
MRARRTSLGPIALGLGAWAALGAAGCDWRDFDHLKENVPVLAVGPDGEFTANGDFGRYVLPMSKPAAGATGGRFLVSAASTACIGVVDVDAKGHVSSRSLADMTFGTETPIAPITSMAEVPGGSKVLLGAPQGGGTVGEFGFGSVYVMTLGAKLSATVLETPEGEDHFGLGVGAGALGGTDAPDYVVASQTSLTIYLDGDVAKKAVAATPPEDCPLEISTSLLMKQRLNRPVLVAPLEGPGAPQVLVGTPTQGTAGAVVVFKVDPTTGQATCDFAYRGAEARFGSALAVGDFNADGTPDLLVGAPPGKAYWIAGPLTKDSPLQAVKLGAGGSNELGSTVAAANLDGKAGDEALVGDPEAKIGDAPNAGEVRIITGSAPAGGMVLDKELHLLRLNEPAAAAFYGVQARALPFCTAGCDSAKPTMQNLALVGAQAQTYAYFMLLPGDKDPRTP